MRPEPDRPGGPPPTGRKEEGLGRSLGFLPRAQVQVMATVCVVLRRVKSGDPPSMFAKPKPAAK